MEIFDQLSVYLILGWNYIYTQTYFIWSQRKFKNTETGRDLIWY